MGDNRIDITLDTGAKSSLWGEPCTDDSREYVFVTRRPPSGTP